MANDLNVKIGADITDLINALKESGNQVNEFSNTIKEAARLIGVGFGLEKLKEFTVGVTELAVQAEGVKNAFAQIPQSTALLAGMRDEVRGTVSDLNLMKDAVHAENLRIPLQNLGTILEFIHVRALATGQDFNTLAESIMTGIGRGSTRSMNDLQISTARVNEEVKKTGSFMSAVMKIAQEEIEKSSGAMSANTLLIEQNGVAWENLKVKIGEFIEHNALVSWALNAANDALTVWNSSQFTFFQKLAAEMDISGRAFTVMAAQLKVVKDEIDTGDVDPLTGLPTGQGTLYVKEQIKNLGDIQIVQNEIKKLQQEEIEATGQTRVNIQQQLFSENLKLQSLKDEFALQERIKQLNITTQSLGPDTKQADMEAMNKSVLEHTELIDKDAAAIDVWADDQVNRIPMIDAGLKKINADYKEMQAQSKETAKETRELTHAFANDLTQAFVSVIDGSKSFSQAMGQMVEQFGEQMLSMALAGVIANAMNPESNGGNYYLGMALMAAGLVAVGAAMSKAGVHGASSSVSTGSMPTRTADQQYYGVQGMQRGAQSNIQLYGELGMKKGTLTAYIRSANYQTSLMGG